MPGVFRPYTLADVLGTINQIQTGAQSQGSVTGIGLFAEADETVPLADSWASTVQAPATWDSGVWGSTSWS
jgi:hypothetical protein